MYTISHIPVPRMYEHAFLMFFFSFIFYLFLFYPKHVYEQSYTHFLCFFFLLLLRQVYDYLMVSVTSTSHFRDTLHFTITTTTMTTPTTKSPPPPPHAQTRPPPFQESQVYIYIYIYFCITNIYLQCVRYVSHDDDNRRPPPSTYEGPRCVFLNFFSPFYSQQKPTAPNDGQRRSTQAYSSPWKANAGP